MLDFTVTHAHHRRQGISVRESEDGTMLVLSLPTLRSPMSYD